MTVELYRKTSKGILITHHDESEVTDNCLKCGGPLVQPPSEMTMLKADVPWCCGCSNKGCPTVEAER